MGEREAFGMARIRPGCGHAFKPWWIGALASDDVKDRLWRPRGGGAPRRP